MRILVIDDEEIIRNLAMQILGREGHEAHALESGQQALDWLQEPRNRLDLVIIDLTLEGLSGADTLVEIRKIIPGCPAIISSGNLVSEKDIPEEQMPNTHFLQKPYRAASLVGKVMEAVPTGSTAG
ncbi:MAG: hypothetical protein DRP45_09430 [Candidatus Zixiibacteriota bacterium]|nr:MAG: hypothetical protein DRP45_09430 [candidate division Zixibacteria bacterium]